MTGAIAGTAILHAPKETERLHTVTLTINNTCNLACSHCYLQYDGSKEEIADDTLERVLNSDYTHLAIVGKEPTLSPHSIEKLIRENKKKGRKGSIITNGHHLSNLTDATIEDLDYIDVSFDGGPDTYHSRRQIPFRAIIDILESTAKRTAKPINALHTLYEENLADLDDMVAIEDYFPFGTIAFSPYKIARHNGRAGVGHISPTDTILPALTQSRKFRESPASVLLVSGSDVADPVRFLEKTESLGLAKKICFSSNPLHSGFVRVTYDGYVLTPHDAIHPTLYKEGLLLNDPRFKDLGEIYSYLRSKEDTQ